MSAETISLIYSYGSEVIEVLLVRFNPEEGEEEVVRESTGEVLTSRIFREDAQEWAETWLDAFQAGYEKGIGHDEPGGPTRNGGLRRTDQQGVAADGRSDRSLTSGHKES